MAKANVLVRRIRAYDRILEAATDPDRHTRRPAPEMVTRITALRGVALAQLKNFLHRPVGGGRSAKGPWAKFATAEDAVIWA